jgi:hypothetical protein
MPPDPVKPKSKALWPKIALLVIFVFLAFECALLAVALKGRWFILLAPAVVCGVKALDAWRELRRYWNSD